MRSYVVVVVGLHCYYILFNNSIKNKIRMVHYLDALVKIDMHILHSPIYLSSYNSAIELGISSNRIESSMLELGISSNGIELSVLELGIFLKGIMLVASKRSVNYKMNGEPCLIF